MRRDLSGLLLASAALLCLPAPARAQALAAISGVDQVGALRAALGQGASAARSGGRSTRNFPGQRLSVRIRCMAIRTT
jgi:hypothetical protein